MKKLLLFLILTACAFNGFSLEKDTAVCEIYLIRHAKVNLKKPFLCTSSKATELLGEYDDLPVLDFDPLPVKALLGDSIHAVFTSTLPRSTETAGILFPGTDTLCSKSLFNEYDLSVISVPLIPLPYVAWTTLSRFFWNIGLNNRDESRFEAYKRMLRATDLLEKQAIEHRRIVLVAHGYLIAEMKRELKKRGWDLEINQGHKNLAVAKLTKAPLPSHQRPPNRFELLKKSFPLKEFLIADLVFLEERFDLLFSIEANYRQVKADIVHIAESEMERIKNDPDLPCLISQEFG